MTPFAPYAFVIDTNQFAGNFNREMCAYITGRLGDCGVGHHYADAAKTELTRDELNNFRDWLCYIPDEFACWRPTTIGDTATYGDRPSTPEGAVHILFSETPYDDLIATMIARAYKFVTHANQMNRNIEILGFCIVHTSMCITTTSTPVQPPPAPAKDPEVTEEPPVLP